MSDKRNLTTGPVWQALARLALPMVVGIVAVLSVSLVDTYFVGRLGTDELAALSFTFPVSLTVTSLSIGLSAGAASVVSRAVGGGDRKDAKRLSTDALILAVGVVILISTFGLLTIRPVFSLLGAEGHILDIIERYMRVWFLSMPFLVVPMAANAIIRSVGDAFWPSLIMVGAAVINIAVTPLFIFGFGPLPALNVEGAAWGTAVARFTTFVFALYIVIFRERLIAWVRPPLEELKSSWIRIIKVGVPAAVGNMTNPLGIAVVTALIAAIGADVVAAFGVATRIESFAAIPMLALSSAIGPVAGQNWGAEKPVRVRTALRWAYGTCAVWSVVLAVIFWVFGEYVAGIFASSEEVAAEAALYLNIVPLSLFGYGIVIVAAGGYNALGKSLTGLGFYLTRIAALYVPLSWLAAMLAGSREVYVAIAAANALSGLLVGAYSLWWLRRHAP